MIEKGWFVQNYKSKSTDKIIIPCSVKVEQSLKKGPQVMVRGHFPETDLGLGAYIYIPNEVG